MNPTEHFMVVGLGGAGGRIANDVARMADGRFRALAIDTDFAAVSQLGHCQQIRIGRQVLDGEGSGGDASRAKAAFDEASAMVAKPLMGATLMVLVLGLGGGTGAGIATAVIRQAKALNIRVAVFAVEPFAFEGEARTEAARRTAEAIEAVADLTIVCRNDALFADGMELPAPEAFARASEALTAGITLLWRLTHTPAFIQVDAATFNNLLIHGRGRADFHTATAEGEHRLDDALSELLDHPVSGVRTTLGNAEAVLLGVLGGEDIRLKEIAETHAAIRQNVSEQCPVMLGTALDPEAQGRLTLTLLMFRAWRTETVTTPEGRETQPPVMPDATWDSQPQLHGGERGTGRFRDTDSTFYGGQNLDLPTYQRRGNIIDIG
ncbi:MAG: hypothetical protein FWF84_02675 [Kiritimatiellaeota bacterium]|nr:hypothetical protein [Kiritimatiellota bacterium]